MKNNIDGLTAIRGYARAFNYKELLYHSKHDKQIFLKEVNKGFVVIESLSESKYVNFYFNGDVKKFKKSDLWLCAMEKIPAAWEAENE